MKCSRLKSKVKFVEEDAGIRDVNFSFAFLLEFRKCEEELKSISFLIKIKSKKILFQMRGNLNILSHCYLRFFLSISGCSITIEDEFYS